MDYLELALGLIVGLIAGSLLGIIYRKKISEAKIGSAEHEAKRILNDAMKAAESKKKESLIEAKEEILKTRNEAEREIKDRRADLQRQERRLQSKEEQFDKRSASFEAKEEALEKRLKKTEAIQAEVEEIKKGQIAMLEKISGYTAEQAKEQLLSALRQEITHETALIIKENEQRIREDEKNKAKEIISLAIQRCAAEHVAESTVSVVTLPNDEMKGRIIGREGRNIRTLETLTGVDLIIDDTPEAITLSSFDPVRREVARLALEKLISDGRIHPARIEEVVEKTRREVDQTIKKEGMPRQFSVHARRHHGLLSRYHAATRHLHLLSDASPTVSRALFPHRFCGHNLRDFSDWQYCRPVFPSVRIRLRNRHSEVTIREAYPDSCNGRSQHVPKIGNCSFRRSETL